MFMFHFIRKSLKTAKHHPRLGGLEILKYIGPGLLVTVGFIDPGNWASNLAAGADYGYTLLWMVSLSTVMLIILQQDRKSTRLNSSHSRASRMPSSA